MRILKTSFTTCLVASLFILGSSCHSLTKTQKGASIGAGAGSIVGAFIGKSAGNTALGAIIGGAVGGTAGAFIGKSMDSQAAELRQNITGATIVRQGETILVKFDSGLLFDPGMAIIKPETETNLKNLAISLQKNPHTKVLIIGHTDNSRAEVRYSGLSAQRADAVKAYIISANIDPSRLTTKGRGAADPIADNSTPEGRAKNRSVEIIISADNQLKKQASSATE